MPSSTSNSSDRAPAGPWKVTWITALVLAGAMLAGAEWAFRGAGHRPMVIDSMLLWSQCRGQVYRAGHKAVVLLGSSRLQLAFDTETFRQRFPDYDVVQLAVGGSPPIATLRDLANDVGFKGIVLCSMMAASFGHDRWDAQQAYVE